MTRNALLFPAAVLVWALHTSWLAQSPRDEPAQRLPEARATPSSPAREATSQLPGQAENPLPDVAALLQDLERNQKLVEELVESYTYVETATETRLNRNGKVKREWEKVYEVYHLGGQTVRKLVKKDGKELTAAEQEKERARVEKSIREFKERQKAGEEGGRNARGRETRIDVSTFLRVDRFTNPRRERFRGQEVIVFDFDPKLDYKPQDRAEKLLQKLVGVAWVDERARQVARLEAHLKDSLKVAGGFVSVQPGSAFVFEQTLVNNEVWLPSYAEAHLSAKAFFLAGLHRSAILRFSDYKKFRVESVLKSASPAENGPR